VGTGAVNVGNGTLVGALGGNGTVNGPVNVSSTGHLAPAMSSSTFNTLTINNNLTLSGGATLDFNLASPGSGDLVNVTGTGNVSLSAGTDILNISGLTGFGIGTYNLISVTGTGTLTDAATFSVNGSNLFNYALAPSGKNLVLTVTAGNPILTWVGNVNGNWVVGGPANWTNGSSAVPFANGNNVIFDDTAAAGARTVAVDAAGVSPNSMSVANTTGTYTFGGGPITVTTGVTKSQAGAATFNNSVTTPITTITGGTFTVGASYASTTKVDVSGGTLSVNGTLTTPIVNVTGGSIAAASATSTLSGSLNYASSTNATFQGVIAGAGNSVTLNKAGTTLTLTGANTYTGPTTVTAGTLVVGSAASLPSPTIIAGTAPASTAVLDVSAVSGGLQIGSNRTLAGHGTLVGSATIASGGTLAPGFNSPGTLTLSTGTLKWNPNGTYAFDHDASATSPPPVTGGANNDLVKSAANAAVLDLTGLGSGSGQQFNLVLNPGNFPATLPTAAVAYTIADYSASTAATPILTPGGATDLTAFFNIGGTFQGPATVALVGGNMIQVTFTPVPEPASCGLLVAAALGMGALVRRRRRRVQN
jgi:fibronectin-binding autotransporter adhesin